MHIASQVRDCSSLDQVFHSYSSLCKLRSGFYIFQLPMGARNWKWLQKELVRLPKCSYSDKIDGITYEVCGMVAYKMPKALNHFISGRPFRKDGRTYMYIYYGMERDGLPQGLTLARCFKTNGGIFSVYGLSIFLTLRSQL